MLDVGKLSDLKAWWDRLTKIGPSCCHGYFVNSNKDLTGCIVETFDSFY